MYQNGTTYFQEDIKNDEEHEQERLVRTVEEFDEAVRLWDVDLCSRTEPLVTPRYEGTLYRQVVGNDEFRIYYERVDDELLAVGCGRREKRYDRDIDAIARRSE